MQSLILKNLLDITTVEKRFSWKSYTANQRKGVEILPYVFGGFFIDYDSSTLTVRSVK